MSNIRVRVIPIKPNQNNLPGRRMKRLRGNLEKYLKKDAGPMLVKEMEKTVANWKGKPSFVQEYSEPFGTQMQIKVFPKGRHTLKWTWVSQGTGPRTITAKKPTGMVFPRDYSPKTTPGGKYGGSGKRSGPIQHRKTVYHETAPRNFSGKIVDDKEDDIIKDINRITDKV